MSSKVKVSGGDWVCPDKRCGNVNFARRTSCNRCGKEKGRVDTFKFTGSQIGKQAAAKSKGLFSADDWMCSKCGNVNWARRSDCNMCGQAKFAKVESRTGYGGGYNEREGVEYVERRDSDDEFDEFGRRKKKNQGSQNKPPEQKQVSQAPENDDENDDDNDDDDDDDDDGDLSKYNLDDDEDDDDDEDGDTSKYNLEESDTNQDPSQGLHLSKGDDVVEAGRPPLPDQEVLLRVLAADLGHIQEAQVHALIQDPDQSPAHDLAQCPPKDQVEMGQGRGGKDPIPGPDQDHVLIHTNLKLDKAKLL